MFGPCACARCERELAGLSDDERRAKESGEAWKVDKEEEARFKDSRGNGPRTCEPSSTFLYTECHSTGRKTEEGFAIYKEDELGISNTGGGKRSFLAVLDSQSCSSCLQTRRYVRSTVIAVSQRCAIWSCHL